MDVQVRGSIPNSSLLLFLGNTRANVLQLVGRVRRIGTINGLKKLFFQFYSILFEPQREVGFKRDLFFTVRQYDQFALARFRNQFAKPWLSLSYSNCFHVWNLNSEANA